MNTRNKMITTVAALAMLLLAISFNVAASANDDKRPDLTIGNKGVIHFNVAVRAGDTLLQPGMYQIQHAVERTDHFITFKKVGMPAGYRHSNNPVAKEAAARIKFLPLSEFLRSE